MITFGRLRSALLTGDSYDALDRLVRSELAAGQKTKAVYDQLLGHIESVRAMPEYTDDLEDRLGDTMDALCGWVHPDCAYQDATTSLALPTEDEIARLPRWAQVAFAARCARRVLPMFLRNWRDAPSSYAKRLTWAVEIGERSAARAGAGEDWAPPAGALSCALYVCDAVNNAAVDHERAIEVINATTVAVAKFKDKPEDIFDSHIGEVFRVLISHASGAIANGMASSEESYIAALPVANSILRRDFDRLMYLTKAQKWTDDTSVPPTIFGVMWPDGLPPGWPDEQPYENEQLSPTDTTVRRISELIGSYAA